MTDTNAFDRYLVLFKEWLITNKNQKKSTAGSRASNVKVIGEYYDLLKEFTIDQCQSVLDELHYSRKDAEPKTSIVIAGNYYNGLATYRLALKLFVAFLKDLPYTPLVPTRPARASFIGSFDEFKRYVGPKCRNEVNIFCKTEREKHGGICEYCGKKSVLQSAHIKERPVIIKEILDKDYRIGPDLYQIPLEDFFASFKAAHMPVPDHIFFLCVSCHDKLDKEHSITVADIKNRRALP